MRTARTVTPDPLDELESLAAAGRKLAPEELARQWIRWQTRSAEKALARIDDSAFSDYLEAMAEVLHDRPELGTHVKALALAAYVDLHDSDPVMAKMQQKVLRACSKIQSLYLTSKHSSTRSSSPHVLTALL
jgi:hypothetical protein